MKQSYKDLEKKIGDASWGWVPSPETMEKVANQLDGRQLSMPGFWASNQDSLGTTALAAGVTMLAANAFMHFKNNKNHDTSTNSPKNTFLIVSGVSLCVVGAGMLLHKFFGNSRQR